MKWILEGEDGRVGEDCGTRRRWVVLVGRGAAEVPRPELERIFGIPTPLLGNDLPPTHPHLSREGISVAPPAGFSRKVKVKEGRGGFSLSGLRRSRRHEAPVTAPRSGFG